MVKCPLKRCSFMDVPDKLSRRLFQRKEDFNVTNWNGLTNALVSYKLSKNCSFLARATF